MHNVYVRFYACLLVTLSLFLGSAHGSVNGLGIMKQFEFDSIDGGKINLGEFDGNPILITNTASNCGFTKQYNDLQKLHDDFSDAGLVVLAIPSEDFFQEFSENQKVKEFCEVNFSLTIPMTTITSVKGRQAHPLYKWLASEHNFRPAWNFNKILFNGAGDFVGSFGAFTSPNSKKIRTKIKELLQK